MKKVLVVLLLMVILYANVFPALAQEMQPGEDSGQESKKGHNPDARFLPTNIADIWQFLQTCPQDDPATATILGDFIIRKNGEVVDDFFCTEPYPEMDVSQITAELTYLQAFRVIYYMDPEVPNHLPWTSLGIYDWMASTIDGVNIVDGVSGGYCCSIIENKVYIVGGSGTDATLNWRKEWAGMSSLVAFIAHEVRHRDGGPGHVTGCEAFPDTVYGCDYSYDLDNLGSYGVQYWLNWAWMTSYLNIGIGCASEPVAESTIEYHLHLLNDVFSRRFVIPPPDLEMPNPPYGGPCSVPGSN